MPTTQEWIDELKSISVLELSERIKALEEAFGVSATAVAAAAPAGGAAADGGGEEAEEQTAFDVVLTGGRRQEDPGDQGRARRDRPRPQGGQGARRRGAEAGQGGHRQGRGRQAQGRPRRGRRHRRAEVGGLVRRAIGSRGAHPVRLRFARGRVGSGRTVGLSFRRSRAGSDYGRSAGRHAGADASRHARRGGALQPGHRGRRRAGNAPHRLLAPGFGASTRLAGRRVASCAADVAAIADALGYDRFYYGGGFRRRTPRDCVRGTAARPRDLRPPRSRRRHRSTPRGSTGPPGWARRTWMSSPRCEAGDDEFEAFLVEHAERTARGHRRPDHRGARRSGFRGGPAGAERRARRVTWSTRPPTRCRTACGAGSTMTARLGHDWGFDLTDIRGAAVALARSAGSVRAHRPRRVAGRTTSPPTPTCGPITGTSPWS